MIIIGAVLLAGCSQDDVTVEVTPQEPVAISFACSQDEKDETNHSTRAGMTGAMNSEDLYYSGFGVFASQTASTPDLMYNQEVKFTFVGDLEDPLKGYWSYQPVKYWPADMEHSDLRVSAYAPYVEPASLEGLPADATGIVGISANNESPYITYRRCEKPTDVVDLLWYIGEPRAIPTPTGGVRGTLDMKLQHALARLQITVALDESVVLAEGTKVLIEEISLQGSMTRTAKLKLNEETTDGDSHYPVWEALETPDVENRTITISNADNDDESYGIIDSQIRYIDGLPYAWQPAGLTTTAQNALSTGDRQTYIYLIPQNSALELVVKVKYHKMTSAGGDETKIKTTDEVPTPIEVGTTVGDAKKLRGSTQYSLDIKLSGI